MFSKKSLFFDDGNKNKPKKYMYDYVFSEDASQEEVYHTTTSPLIKDVLKGYSAAVFAYGATGTHLYPLLFCGFCFAKSKMTIDRITQNYF